MRDKVTKERSQMELLSRQLADIDSQLQALTAGDVDAVIGPDGSSFLLRQSQIKLLQSEDELRELAQELQRERAKLVAAQAVAKIGSWSIEVPSRVVDWSEEMYRIFDLKPTVLPPSYSRFLDLVHPDDRDLVNSQLRRSFEDVGNQFLEHRLSLPDGMKFVEQRWQIERDGQGKAIRAFGTCQDTTARRAADDALRQSQAELKMATRLSRVGAWSVTLGSPGVWWSDEVCAVHEVEPGTSPSLEQALEYYPVEWRPLIQKAVSDCIEMRTPFDLELEILLARGRRVWVRSIGEAICDSTGHVVRIQGAFQDLSDRKRTENELRRLAKRLTTTLESLTVGFFSVDPDWRITYFNIEAERILGRRRQDVLGHDVWQALPQLAGEFESAFRQAATTGRSLIREGKLSPSDLWFHATVYPSDEGIAVLMRDITLEHAASLQLKLLEASVEKLHDIILITDADPLNEPGPRIRFANEALTRCTGYTPAEVIGRSPRFLQGPETDRGELDRIRSALSRFEPVHAELLNYRKDGEPYWVELDIVPVAAAGNVSAHFVAVERDITERKRTEDALRQLNLDLENRVLTRTAELSAAREEAESASRAKSTFLAAVSHEIRTPMNGVIGLIDVLSHSSLLPPQVEMVRLVRDSAESLLSIIDDILDFSKIEAGKLQIERAPIRLQEVLEKVGGLLATMARRQNVGMTVFVDPDIPETVLGDQLRLRQILINLIGNAIKFSSGGDHAGRVSVRVELLARASPKVTIEFTVSDNGVGIDNKARAGLFQPFFQADASTTRQFGGTGLGLAITKMLVDLQGGQLAVESALGEGATFSVKLPFETVPNSGATAIGALSLTGLLCRIIGGEDRLASDLSRYLSHADAKVERLSSDAVISAAVQNADSSIWLILPGASQVALQALRTLAAQCGSPKRFVCFGFGIETEHEIDHELGVTVDLDTLTRTSLLRSVAAAAGRLLAPALDSEASSAGTTANSCAAGGNRSERVLVAEDNETNREVIERQLKLLGLDAEMTVNGQQALERWRSGKFHLVLTDVRMPIMDGYALARAIRAEETDGRRTAIIALTANALPEEEGQCLAAGMDQYLVKPITTLRLKAAVQRWLSDLDRKPVMEPVVVEPASSSVNLEFLKSLIGDDPTGIAAVLEKFQVNSSQLNAELELAIKSEQFAAIVEIAHKLKSGAFSVGAERLGELCVEIEHAAAGGNQVQLGALLPQFRAQIHAVHLFIDAARR
jgi:PAS domain S-box-containing protein